MMKLKLKKDDTVVIVSGKDKGKTGKIAKVYPKERRVIVTGINLVKKHQKPTQTKTGGIVQKEMPIHISNVALEDPKSKKPTRVGFSIERDKKVRIAKKSGILIS